MFTADWSVPVGAWRGQPAFILGGGPSLRGFDVNRLRGRGRVIAVNDAGLVLAPWADVLFYADRRWLDWNHADLALFRGRYIISRRRPHLPILQDVLTIGYAPSVPLSRDPERVGGYCGGGNALNLAYLFGADPIVLLGFDMRPGNWHDRHQAGPLPNQHADKFIPALNRMSIELAAEGRTVLNASHGSELRCFPIIEIEAFLDGRRVELRPAERHPGWSVGGGLRSNRNRAGEVPRGLGA